MAFSSNSVPRGSRISRCGSRIRRWQPQLRTLFVMRIASLKYRFQVPGFELPEPIRLAQRAYDDRSVQILEEMAERIEGSVRQREPAPEDAFELLEKTIEAYYEESQQSPAAHVWSFTTLLRGIDSLTNISGRATCSAAPNPAPVRSSETVPDKGHKSSPPLRSLNVSGAAFLVGTPCTTESSLAASWMVRAGLPTVASSAPSECIVRRCCRLVQSGRYW